MADSTFPVVARPDVTTAVITPQYAGGVERQRDLVRADDRVRHSGLVSVSWFASTDGESVLTYAQWADEPVGETGVRYRLYRSLARTDEARVPGCLVTAVFDVDGPERQRTFVDSLIAALPDEDGHPGAISAHFHLSTDGTRVLNYTEWTTEQAHLEATESGNHDELYEIFAGTPGVRPLRGLRYHLLDSWST
ncbi:antibiotic biosynthesis monooxygenase [Saccharopolyspora taberi]|uniref:Antibiotic biosynthesis monooxygenase n=1 Tax=Saccharopolyspora taberi TaxID=60895 RepID=A0ABN3VFX1_9PSEU